MGNSASRKAGSASTPQSPAGSASQGPSAFQSFPGSPTNVPVRIPTGPTAVQPAGAAVPVSRTGAQSASHNPHPYRQDAGLSPVPVYPVSATAPTTASRIPASYAPSSPVPMPGGPHRSTSSPFDNHPIEAARTMPIGIPQRGPASHQYSVGYGQSAGPIQPVGRPSESAVHHPSGRSAGGHPIGISTRIDSEDLLAGYRNEYARPPRLPLAIEDDNADMTDMAISHQISGIETGSETGRVAGSADQFDGHMPATVDGSSDDEDGPDEKAKYQGRLVPTLIEWGFGGSKVYVTGTFANWNRKFRLHKNGPSSRPDVLSTVLNLQPGTHHLKFIVDNDLRLSPEIATTVDYTNILVNYIDVIGLDSSSTTNSASAISGSAGSDGRSSVADGRLRADRILARKRAKWAKQRVGMPAEFEASVSSPLNVLPAGTVIRPEPPIDATMPASLQVRTNARFHSRIPRFLLDMEDEPTSIPAARSAEVISRLYVPPTLPLFLARSILNTATPLKDDASVLATPNHTVLNHLATSSIKQNVLATSATTRYRKKFLTTIMHKPVGEGQA